ncbi:MAG TPA: hypothetical protein VFH65_31100, partial [Mycobacterium sp.]|nr:hypothetical protein [Mycobacterium sp.]
PSEDAAQFDPAAEEQTMRVSQPPPASPPPPPPSAAQPHRAPTPPPPHQPYGGQATSAPTPPPYGGPGYGQPQRPTTPPPPPGYGAPQPGPPHQPYPPGASVPPYTQYGPNTSQSPVDAANALLAKGNSLITRLMSRGIRGELIRQPWFLNFRHQSADSFVYVTFGIGLLMAIVLALLPGIIGTIITDLIWASLIYLYFALGTKLAHQFIAYGICGGGVALALLSALYTGATFIDLASVYFAGTAVLLLISLGLTLVSAVVLAYVGVQVYRGIQKLSSP